jgi:hypothetical protein
LVGSSGAERIRNATVRREDAGGRLGSAGDNETRRLLLSQSSCRRKRRGGEGGGGGSVGTGGMRRRERVLASTGLGWRLLYLVSSPGEHLS